MLRIVESLMAPDGAGDVNDGRETERHSSTHTRKLGSHREGPLAMSDNPLDEVDSARRDAVAGNEGESTTKLSLPADTRKLLAITQRQRRLLHFRDGRRRAPEHRYAGRYA
ncbi:hypothetical protein MRX96_024890 [Rhipicephalus microplus]